VNTRPPGQGVRPATLLVRRRDRLARWLRGDDRPLLAFLVLLTLVAAALMYLVPAVTAVALVVPLLLTDLFLAPRRIPGFLAFLVGVLVLETLLEVGGGIPARRWVTSLVVLVMVAVVLLVGWRRNRLGVGGLTGEAMLVDLRDRLNRQGEIPALPLGWDVDAATRSAGGTSFAGDFMVAHLEGGRLSMALVDVSGKGVEAGTRALLLSGAFGALLGAAPPAGFLAAANDFLLRQDWEEGFATAVHLCLDLAAGTYEVRHAGHPPTIHFQAGSGRWDPLQSSGPALGLLDGASFAPSRGQLRPGDALLLYTDGLVERPGVDIGLGIDRLIGEAERLVPRGFAQAATRLVATLGSPTDDCALIAVQRV
jgi:hypothetical protein